MKKIASLLSFLVVVFLAALAMPIYAQNVPITEENLAILKGKWEGEYSTPSRKGNVHLRMELEIINDCLPVKGVIIRHLSLGNPSRWEFKNGIIEKGKLSLQGGKKQWVRFSLYENKGKLELRGEFRWDDGRFDTSGTIFLEKQ